MYLIFKNEAPYLKEWIEYHRLIGIQHFYLYNNSSDNYEIILQTYIDKGIVTLFNWLLYYNQLGAYENCYNKFKNESHWIGFIDTDEFINLSVDELNLVNLLKKYRKFPSLHMFWRNFGTLGIINEDNSKLVIEQFISCWPWLSNVGKCFINNDWEFTIFSPHWQKTKFLGIIVFPILDNKSFSPYSSVSPINY